MSKVCLTHNKEFKYFCVSSNCKEDHAGVCESPECLSLHDHPIRSLILISKLKDVIQEGHFPLQQLLSNINSYFDELVSRINSQLK